MTRKAKAATPDIPVIEWIVGITGLVLVLAMIGLLAYEGIYGDNSAPDIEVQLVSEHDQSQSHMVSVMVHNKGGEPAATLKIQGELLDAQNQVIETAYAEIDYLPGKSSREAGLIFSKQAGPYQLKLRALGYETP